MTDNNAVDLNEPVTLYGKKIFCPVGNALAIQFLDASRDAVIQAQAENLDDLAWRVERALATLLKHRLSCGKCEVESSI